MSIGLPETTLLWPVCAVLAGMLGIALWRLRSLDHSRLMLEVELYGLANHDNMTGLFNRRRFEDEVAGHMARVRRYGGPTTVLVIDLDRFGKVNQELGRSVGDSLLTSVARDLPAPARQRRGRPAGRRLVRGAAARGRRRGRREAVANDLLATVRSAVVEVPDAGIAWNTASIGVAYDSDSASTDPRELIAAADGAMRKAKRSRGDSVAFADPVASDRAPYPTWA